MEKTVKRKHLFLTIGVTLLAAGGLWLAGPWTSQRWFQQSSMSIGDKMPDGSPKPGQMLKSPARLAPPNPNRKFEKLSPEERVKLARRGPIGG
jgi:hypothetical protein